jgi:UDP-glucose 4-epimerase
MIALCDRKIVIVGGGGFLGSAFTKSLSANGAHVTVVDVIPDQGTAAHWITCDTSVSGVPEGTLDDADVLIHLAWRNDPGRGNTHMQNDVLTNVAGAVQVFQQAADAGVRRIVYASSGGTVYGRASSPIPESAPFAPIGGYGAGKAAAELYLNAMHHAFGVQACVLRFANPYGPGQFPNRGQGFIATAIARTLLHQPLEIFGSLSLARDYVYIDDVARAVTIACADETPQIVLNVGTGRAHTLAQLTERIFAAVGRETEIVHTPGRLMDIPHVALDIREIGVKLGWSPTTELDDGLAQTVSWLRTLPEFSAAA